VQRMDDEQDMDIGGTGFSLQQGMRGLLIGLLCLAGLGLWAFFQYKGLRSPVAMEQADIARNLAGGRGFVTNVLRPFDLWMTGQDAEAVQGPVPAIWHAPLYPYILSWMFRIMRVSYSFSPGGLLDAEVRTMVPLSILLLLFSAWSSWSLAKRIFDERVAHLSLVLLLVSALPLQLVLDTGALPLGMALAATMGLLAWKAIESSTGEGRALLLMLFSSLAGMTGGLLLLTHYAALPLVAGMLVFIALNVQRLRWLVVGLFMAHFLVVVLPWVCSQQAYGWWGVMAYPYGALLDTSVFQGDSLLREVQPVLRNWQVMQAIREGIANRYGLFFGGETLLVAGFSLVFFLASLFQRDERHWNRHLKWMIAATLLTVPVFPLVPGEVHGVWPVFLPFMLMLGAQAFCTMLDQEDYFDASVKPVLTGCLIVFCLLPSSMRLLQRGTGSTYPPYHGPLQAYAGRWTSPGQVVVSDIPWAVAWYARKASLLWPNQAEDVLRYGDVAGAIYLADPASSLQGGDPAWLRMRLDAVVPDPFPFAYGMFLPAGLRDQVLLLRDRPAE
jgi:hypothetical protein